MSYKGELASNETNHYLDSIGLRSFTEGERRSISNIFSSELEQKLKNPEAPTSIKMIDTHLSPVSGEVLSKHVGDEALILEIGGTNIYGGWVGITKEGPRLLTEESGKLESRGEVSTRTFETPQALFSEVFSIVEAVAGLGSIKHLGIIFTFPAVIEETHLGVDVRSQEKQAKGFIFKGIHVAPVGQQFVEFMRQSGKYQIHELKNLVVLNDTPAALLSTPSKIGGIVGTGYNLAVMVGGRIYNIECGGASGVPSNELAKQVDVFTKSVDKKEQLSEKQISGMYLGMQLGFAIEKMNFLGYTKLRNINPGKVRAEVLSYILSDEWDKVQEHLQGHFDIQTKNSLRTVAYRLRERSAELVAIQISTIINKFPQEFGGEKITIPIEGSLFWKMTDYRKIVTNYLTKYTGKSFEFPFTEHAGAIGAGVAAIGLRG